MAKYFNILLWIPLLYAVLFLSFSVVIIVNEQISFEQFVLEKQSNYASDSAIDELLVASDISTDYGNGDVMKVEPSLALNDFAHTLCLDFDYVPTESTLNKVKQDNLRALLVCAWDGIYAHYKQKTETHGYELKQTPKIPYFYTNDKTGKQYCLTLDPNKGYWDYDELKNPSNPSKGTVYKLHDYDIYDEKPSEDRQRVAINERVADILNWALYCTYTADTSETKVAIPALSKTIRGDQPVNGPAVIAVVKGRKSVFTSAIVAESIAGAQIENADPVVGYTFEKGPNKLTGKLYAYQSFWAKHPELVDASIEDSGLYFDSAFEAAAAGYNDLNLYDE